jgi:hypothetical protein
MIEVFMETDETIKQSATNKNMSWVWISGIAFLISLAASTILIFFGNKLDDLGIAGNIYYIILVPLGFSSAAFLAGAMKSYALFKSNKIIPYGRLFLSGPIVIFALVVVGGFIMPGTLKKDTAFDLKIRIVNNEKETSSFNQGLVKVYAGKSTYDGNIHEGEVTIPNIPTTYYNKKVKIITEIDNYQLAGAPYVLLSKNIDNIEIPVIKKAESLRTEVRGTIVDEHNTPIRNAVINFASGLAISKTNENGDFICSVPLQEGGKIPLKILVKGIVVFNNNITLSSKIPLDLKINSKP